jgi:hypothetical protein
MTTRELLAKATAVFHLCEKWCLSPSELSRKYQKRFQIFLQKAWMKFEFSSMRWLKNTTPTANAVQAVGKALGIGVALRRSIYRCRGLDTT